MRKGANFLRWILTVFMVISAIVFFPSVSSVLCLLFAVLAAPVKALQRFWKYQVKLRGGGKALLMTALVIGAALTAPLEPAPQAPAEDDRQQEIQETVQETVPEEPDASSQGQTVSQDASSETVPEDPQAPAEQAPVPPAEEAPQPSAETPPDVPEAPSEEPAQSLPEPETPAMPTIRFSGTLTVTFFKLCTRAPRTWISRGAPAFSPISAPQLFRPACAGPVFYPIIPHDLPQGTAASAFFLPLRDIGAPLSKSVRKRS